MAKQVTLSPAEERYLALLAAIDRVQEALDETDRLIRKMVQPRRNRRTATREELQGMRRDAQSKLDGMRDTAKKYEAELMAKEWRK